MSVTHAGLVLYLATATRTTHITRELPDPKDGVLVFGVGRI